MVCGSCSSAPVVVKLWLGPVDVICGFGGFGGSAKSLVAAADGGQRLERLCPHLPQIWRSSTSSSPVYSCGLGLCGGGGV